MKPPKRLSSGLDARKTKPKSGTHDLHRHSRHGAGPWGTACSCRHERTTLTRFDELGLTAPLLKALAAANHSTPTPIQLRAIPPILAGKDLLGIAQTGTGKTAAFALPMLQRLAASRRRPEPHTCRA